MQVMDMRNVSWGNGTIKACFSIKLPIKTANNQSVSVVIKDLKLIEGSNGLFIGSPQVPYEKDGEKKYKSIIDIDRTLQSALVELVGNVYDADQTENVIYTEKSWKPQAKSSTDDIPF